MKNYFTVTAFFSLVLLSGVLFAFKSEEPRKEYATIQYIETSKKDAIVTYVNGEKKSITTESFNDEKKFLEVLNALAEEGWYLSTTDYASTGSYTKRVVYLERVKQ